MLQAVAVNNLGKWKTATQMTALIILLATRDSRFLIFFLHFNLESGLFIYHLVFCFFGFVFVNYTAYQGKAF